MKKYLLIIASLVCVFALTACKKQDSNDYRTTYAGHYDTLNYMVSQSASDNELYANFVDGLVENDNYGKIIPSLAKSWKSEIKDGKQVWTFDIRKGVKWVEQDGTEYADVKAQDWVTAAEYILNPQFNSEVTGLWFLFIDGAENYWCSLADDQTPDGEDKPSCTEAEDYVKNTDIASVGVRAVDDYTLEYTLAKPAPYFLTALTYNPFFPVNEDYLKEMGTDFGYDGTSILYNGAYILTEDVMNSKVVMEKNDKYWDKGNVFINKITRLYVPDDAGHEWYRVKYETGEIDGFRIKENDAEGWEKYVTGECYGDQCEGTILNPVNPAAYAKDTTSKYTYYMLWNWERENFDGSEKTESDKAATEKALLNANFRLGFFHGMDMGEFLGYYTSGNPTQWSRNSYTPRKLATDQNGVDYVDHFAQYYADQNNMTQQEAIDFLADGHDTKFDADIAKAYFADAKTELLANGLTEDDFPIIVESIASDSAEALPYYKSLVNAFNDVFGDYVEWTLLVPDSGDQWQEWSNQKLGYDLRWMMGWGPDYADPHTYLNTYAVNGDMLYYSGIDDNEELQQEILGSYDALVKAADAITDESKLAERFDAYAKAEYHLLFEQALIIPYLSPSGKDVYVSNIKPYTAMDAPYGLSSVKYKYMIVLDESLTREERAQLKAEYEAGRTEK